MNAKNLELMLLRAINARKKGDLAGAAQLYRAVLSQNPANRRALAGLADIEVAVQVDGPPTPQELSELARTADRGNPQEIIALGEALLRRDPQSALINGILAASYATLKRFDDARDAYRLALAGFPDEAVLQSGFGEVLVMTGDAEGGITAYRKALAIDPKMAKTAILLARALHKVGRIDEAIDAYRAAAPLDPGARGLHLTIGNLLRDAGRRPEAVMEYEREFAQNPDDELCLSQLFFERLKLCDWGVFDWFGQYADRLGQGRTIATPFALLAFDDDPAKQRARAETMARHTLPGLPDRTSRAQARNPGERIRIGYFTCDFGNHPVLQLFAGVLRNYDRSQFELHVFSYRKNKNSKLRDELIPQLEYFYDVDNLNNDELIYKAISKNLDIAVDLSGYTGESRTKIFANRLASLHMNFLGFPGTMGSSHFDYMIGDHFTIPDQSRQHYCENIIYMPHTYLVTDNQWEITRFPSREDCGLPPSGVVFCALSNSYKVAPESFDVWCRLLSQVRDSVLWMSGGDHQSNVLAEAARRGIDPSRIVFARWRLPREHIGRMEHADLFLDTFNYNGHTTAAEALSVGLPVVTRYGRSFPSRVAASLLTAAGLPELITSTTAEYEALALALARDPARRAALRQKIIKQNASFPLFDSARFTRNLEAGFREAIDRHSQGLSPADINVIDPEPMENIVGRR